MVNVSMWLLVCFKVDILLLQKLNFQYIEIGIESY